MKLVTVIGAVHSREDVGAPADGLGGRDQTLRPAVVLLVELLRRRRALRQHTHTPRRMYSAQSTRAGSTAKNC